MPSDPNTTQITLHSDASPHHNNKKKRRLQITDSEVDGSDGTIEGSQDEEDDESSDDEPSIADITARKQRREALRKKQKDERGRDNMIGIMIDSHPTPRPSSSLGRALHEYVKMVMGIPRKQYSSSFLDGIDPTLPEPPTVEEQQSWLNQKTSCELIIRKAINKSIRKYLASKPKNFKPRKKEIHAIEKDAAETAMLSHPLRPVSFLSRILFSGRSKYAHSWGVQCEGALALAGFPRATCDWRSGYDSPWNSAFFSILIQQWCKCHDSKGARAFGVLSKDNTPENREELLRTWFDNKCPMYRDQIKRNILMKTPEGQQQIRENKAIAKSTLSRRMAKSKISKARSNATMNNLDLLLLKQF